MAQWTSTTTGMEFHEDIIDHLPSFFCNLWIKNLGFWLIELPSQLQLSRSRREENIVKFLEETSLFHFLSNSKHQIVRNQQCFSFSNPAWSIQLKSINVATFRTNPIDTLYFLLCHVHWQVNIVVLFFLLLKKIQSSWITYSLVLFLLVLSHGCFLLSFFASQVHSTMATAREEKSSF